MCGRLTEAEIGKEAARLEQVAVRSEGALAQQLHEMCPEDRLAVAKRMVWDQQQHPSTSLPKIEFYDDGDLKSAERKDADGDVECRVYDDHTGRLVVRELKDKDSWQRYQHDPRTGKLTAYDRVNDDGSREHSEFADNGNRTVMVRTDAKGNEETVTFDPATGKEVASDIKFKDKSTLHIVFDLDGSVKELDCKDRAGNVYHWKRDSQDKRVASVTDIPNPYPMTGVDAREIKFANGFRVHLDFAPSSTYIWKIFTSDRDVKGVKNVNISYITRR
ncbi:MAG TPA: hypothetical protein V6D08_04215 [Candidatus Obscuribacterales bacterium]